LVLDGRHIEALEVTGMHGNRIQKFERELHPNVIDGADMSEGMLEKARARSNREKWLRGPAEQLPFDDGTLDAVVTPLRFTCLTSRRRYENSIACWRPADSWPSRS
jgi:ubiquinone/menaquinone biosynthesis C-methylase UbiE